MCLNTLMNNNNSVFSCDFNRTSVSHNTSWY